MNNKKRNRKGFTIVELSIVIAVIAILAVAMIPVFGGIIGDSKDAQRKQAAKNAYTSYSLAAVDAGEDVKDEIIVKITVKDETKYYKVNKGVLGEEVTVTGAAGDSYFCVECNEVVKYVPAVVADPTNGIAAKDAYWAKADGSACAH